MKYIVNKSGFLLVATFVLGFIFSSCEDYLDKNPVSALTADEYYQNEDDANAAVRGIYGKLAYLAPRILILNELNADLMDVTYNADEYYREINQHQTTVDNPYIDATEFYTLINNCNDALYNFDVMLKEKRFASQKAYDERYSDIAALRSWLYLNLVVLYGEVPYITEPLNTVEDLRKITDKNLYPYLDIQTMVDTLYNFMKDLPLDNYTDLNLKDNIRGFNGDLFYINKYIFWGDICLWKGDYYGAAVSYKKVMDDYGDPYELYKCKVGVWAYKDMYYQSGYIRFYEDDIYSEINTWPDMFSDMNSFRNYFQNEYVWVLFYDNVYEPFNPFYTYFSKNTGNYIFKPAQGIIRNWNQQERHNSYFGDFRGEDGSYEMIDGEPVITKHISMYDPTDTKNKQGKLGIFRGAGVHLRFSEAVNRYGEQTGYYVYHKMAYGLVNNGIYGAFHSSDTADLSHDGFTPLNPDNPLELVTNDPLFMDGRAIDVPYTVRGTFCRNGGVRGRVYLKDKHVDDIDNIDTEEMEDYIINEAALELAFEGSRWHDLVRISLRRNDNEFLASRVASKFDADSASVCEYLKNRDNWFLPFK